MLSLIDICVVRSMPSVCSENVLIAWKQDEDHDDWNCTKWACNHASWFPWRVICMLAPVFTMSVAPFQTRAFGALQEEALDMFVKAGIQGRFFQLHKSDIAADLGMEAPTTAEEEDLVLKNLIIAMKGGTARGEDMKMSLWYAFMRQYKVRKCTWWGTVAVLKHWHVFVRKKNT